MDNPQVAAWLESRIENGHKYEPPLRRAGSHGPGRIPYKREALKEFLFVYMKSLPHQEGLALSISNLCVEEGYSKRLVDDVKKELGIISIKVHAIWYWVLPDE
jgi:hypothetical protein